MNRAIPKDRLIGNLSSRYSWKKVERPITWRPENPNEELVGYYGGKTIRNGKWGQYEVALVHVPSQGSFLLSGVNIIQAFDVANIGIGWPVKVVWKGREEFGAADAEGKKKSVKMYEVFVAEGDPVAPEYLPRVQGMEATQQ